MRVVDTQIKSILHVCGGDPTYDANDVYFSVVFSTYVEVIPSIFHEAGSQNCILHVCGGDPFIQRWIWLKQKYSPRMWR